MFRAYLEAWRAKRPADWSAFVPAIESLFEESDLEVKAAPVGSLLASNLEFVLRECSEPRVPIRDVLLLLVPAGWSRKLAAPGGFTLAQLEYDTVQGSHFVKLAPHGLPLR